MLFQSRSDRDSRSQCYGVSLVDGQSQWVLKTKGRVFSSAFAQFDHFFVGSDDANLYAIHGYSGRKAWNYTADGEVRSRPFVNDQMIVFSCNLGYVYAPHSTVSCVGASRPGEAYWHHRWSPKVSFLLAH